MYEFVGMLTQILIGMAILPLWFTVRIFSQHRFSTSDKKKSGCRDIYDDARENIRCLYKKIPTAPAHFTIHIFVWGLFFFLFGGIFQSGGLFLVSHTNFQDIWDRSPYYDHMLEGLPSFMRDATQPPSPAAGRYCGYITALNTAGDGIFPSLRETRCMYISARSLSFPCLLGIIMSCWILFCCRGLTLVPRLLPILAFIILFISCVFTVQFNSRVNDLCIATILHGNLKK